MTLFMLGARELRLTSGKGVAFIEYWNFICVNVYQHILAVKLISNPPFSGCFETVFSFIYII